MNREQARALCDEECRHDEREHLMVDTVVAERIDRARRHGELLFRELGHLVNRCDGREGIRADGSNIDTRAAHMLLAIIDPENWGDEVEIVRAAIIRAEGRS